MSDQRKLFYADETVRALAGIGVQTEFVRRAAFEWAQARVDRERGLADDAMVGGTELVYSRQRLVLDNLIKSEIERLQG